MADINERTEGLSNASQLATFRIGGELFGLGISSIREIVRYPEITAVPRSPAYLTGLANMRGNVLPVVDARLRLGMPSGELTDATRVLVIEHSGLTTGLVVDSVCGVINLERIERESPPPLLGTNQGGVPGVDARYVKSVIKADGGRKIIMEIDADALCLTEVNGGGRGLASSETSRTLSRGEDCHTSLNEIQLVTFLVAREEYAFPIASVREVLRISEITEVPDVAPYLLGILSIRNALLPIVDIRKLFGLPSLEESLTTELNELSRFARHLGTSFEQHLTCGAAWTTDATWSAARNWFESLHTSSELLGRQYQLLRLTFQKWRALVTENRRDRGQQPDEARNIRVLGDSRTLIEQIELRIAECKNALGTEIQEDQRILVIEIGSMPVGILVDRMQQVARLSEQLIEHPPMLLNAEKASTLRGVVKLNNGNRLVMLIDQDRMLREGDLGDVGNGIYQSGGEILPPEKLDDSGSTLQIVTFRLDDELFGLSIEDVQEINRLDDITAVPRAPEFMEGVMNLRGNVIPALDLRRRFGLPTTPHDESTRVIIVTMNNRLTGLIVDSVSEVLRLDRQAMESPPEVLLTDMNTRFIKSICKDSRHEGKMIMLIEVTKILADHEQELLHASFEGTAPSTSPEASTVSSSIPEPQSQQTVVPENPFLVQPLSSEKTTAGVLIPDPILSQPEEDNSSQQDVPVVLPSVADPGLPRKKKLKRAT